MVAHLQEEITLHGRRFTLTIEGPDSTHRYSAYIREISTDQLLTRNPVRGRSASDARDRALEVMYNLLGIERLQSEIIALAAEVAPGATVDLTEDAQAIRAELQGPWHFTEPLAFPRDEVADPQADIDELRAHIRAHFQSFLRPTAR